ncbi:amidohydrolase family protein [Desulforhopalus singaporensis]|uniref:Amidohydrolase-related domain-containing protein n=1 Tax=Desulforhopalus singaporensis TaxID=91360 RepID=A0A1H0J430_9BACT|nr:amidohydrolase family protein [Desulforhopalus singaporensis]SDO38466.1 hypothetical protein SAMN05660330_00140 [Desulforhopalus singaporensis]
MLNPQMKSLNDPEGHYVPSRLPPVIDSHVHIFPRPLFAAVRRWFDDHGWTIRYRLRTREVFDYLLSRGVRHIVALQYAHKKGIARGLNGYMAEQCKMFSGQVTGLATVYPGEEDAVNILQEAFDSGLKGVKLHAHVQCFDINHSSMEELYDCCIQNDKPLLMHIGREPKSPAYPCDPYKICKAEKLEEVLRNFPDLKICVPHLGVDEVSHYHKLSNRYDNLWLDTAMVITDYLPFDNRIELVRYRTDRIMYGSDFPNIPYAWDRELRELQDKVPGGDNLRKICAENAAVFFNIEEFR